MRVGPGLRREGGVARYFRFLRYSWFGGIAVIYLLMVVFSKFLANEQLTLGRAVECWLSVRGTYIGVCDQVQQV